MNLLKILTVRRSITFVSAALLLLLTCGRAAAQGGDLTIFVGTAYPVYDERLTLRASTPSLPGVEISTARPVEIQADGGLVFGGALAFELGILGIEGRLDATDVGFDVAGTRYDLLGTSFPAQGLRGSVTIGDGRLDANRLYLLSVNARLRTPGPIGLVASGGLSYLPDITIAGSAPLSAEIGGFPVAGGTARVRLAVAPGESTRRAGLNGGLGLRIGGSRIAVIGEVRAFYFGDYELRFEVDDAPDVVQDLLDGIEPIRFKPIIVNAQAGLVFRF
jgi:hypothetical protein